MHSRGVLVTIIFISCLSILSATVISPSLPYMADYFGGTESVKFKVKLLIALPGLFTAISAPIAGWLIDVTGRKKILYVGLTLYIIAGAGSGLLLKSLNAILIGRIFLGIAIGILFTVGTTFITDYYSGHKRNQVMGLQTGFIGLTAIASLSLGGFLADFHWRLPFAVLLCAMFAFPISMIFLHEDHCKEHAGIKLPKIAWLWQLKILPIMYITMCITLMMFYFVPIEIPFYLTTLNISRHSTIGIILSIFNVAAAISAMSYARVKAKLHFSQVFGIAYGFMGTGFLCIALAKTALGPDTLLSPIQGLILGLIFHGLGFGLTVPNAGIWIQHETPAPLRGRVNSGLTTFLFLGQFLSPFLAELLYAFHQKAPLLSPLFGASALLCFLLSLFFLSFKYSKKLFSLENQKRVNC